MSRITNILNDLQLNLSKKYNKAELESMFGHGFTTHYPAPGLDDPEDDYVDVPRPSDDTPYVTYRSITPPKGKKAGSNTLPFPSESKLTEQGSDKEKDPNKDSDVNNLGIEDKKETEDPEQNIKEPTDETVPEDVGNEVPEVPGLGTGEVGNTGFGMLGQEEPKTAGQLGRIYELKKIYTRLTSIESYLSDESSKELMEIRNKVSQAIELFEIISANFDSYKDKLDDMIIMFYKFIREVYSLVRSYYSKESKLGD